MNKSFTYKKKREVICKRCNVKFNTDKRGKLYCSEKCSKKSLEEWFISWRLERRGLNEEKYQGLLKEQGDRCAICGSDDPKGRGRWHIDHDHKTGVIRGLLCYGCNVGLGLFKDDSELLQKAAAYVLKKR